MNDVIKKISYGLKTEIRFNYYDIFSIFFSFHLRHPENGNAKFSSLTLYKKLSRLKRLVRYLNMP